MYSTLQIHNVQDTCKCGEDNDQHESRIMPSNTLQSSLSCPTSPLPVAGVQCSHGAQLSLAPEDSDQGKALLH